MTACRSCDAPIRWTYTVAGARMPVDHPVPDASPERLEQWGRTKPVEPNVAMVDGFAQTLGALDLAAGDPPASLVPHWATCPQSREWKGPKR